MIRFTTTAAAAAIGLLALTGCSSSPAGEAAGTTGGDLSAGSEDGGGSPTGCLVDRMWTVDVDDLAEQLLAQMRSLGSLASSATGTGTMTITFAEETLVNTVVDVTFEIVVPVENGPTMTVTQHQYGSGYGSWLWDGGTPNLVVFEDWVGDYDIDMTMTVDGTSVESPIELPASAAGGSDMTVRCDGDTLTTKAEGSPFTQRWIAG